MISEPDYSYLGSGHLLVREYGAAAPFLAIGNCSALEFAPQVNTVQLTDFTSPGGGPRLHLVVEAEREPQRVEARTEVGGGGGDGDVDFHSEGRKIGRAHV